MSPEHVLVALAVGSSLLLSSIAGYGGSLILVPTLGALLGPKEGIAFAALLLAWNNAFKVVAYRRDLSLRRGWPLVVASTAGVWVGAKLLLAVDEGLVVMLVVLAAAGTLAAELFGNADVLHVRSRFAIPMMAVSGLSSGVSGSSGPLKGSSIRCLALPRAEHVGLASAVSLVADSVKVEVFASAGLLSNIDISTLALALPLMPLSAWMGRRINDRIGEGGFRVVFWVVVGGYTARMLGALA